MGSKEIKPGVYQYVPDESIRLHRGLNSLKTEDLHLSADDHPGASQAFTYNSGRGAPGIHWTDDKQIAENFAKWQTGRPQYTSPSTHATVLSGDVHPDDVLGPHTPGWESLKEVYDIFDRDSHEREHTLPVKPTIKNLSATQFKKGVPYKHTYLGNMTNGVLDNNPERYHAGNESHVKPSYKDDANYEPDLEGTALVRTPKELPMNAPLNRKPSTFDFHF